MSKENILKRWSKHYDYYPSLKLKATAYRILLSINEKKENIMMFLLTTDVETIRLTVIIPYLARKVS